MLLPLLLAVGLVVPDDDAWRDAMEIATFLVFVYALWQHGLGHRPTVRLLGIPIAWIAWLGISGGWGTAEVRDDWDSQSMGALLTAMYLVACVVFLRVARPGNIRRVGLLLVAASAVPLALGLALHLTQHGVASIPRIVGIGFFANPNRAAAMIVLLLLLTFCLIGGTDRRPVRLLLLGYVVLAVCYMLLTGSRGGLATLVLTMSVYEIVRGGRAFARKAAAAIAIFLVVAVAMVGLIPGFEEAMWQNLTRSTHRLDIWRETLRLAAERPILGYGLKYDEPILGTFSHPHNIHLSNLLYGGLPALILGVASFVATAVVAWRIPERRLRALALAGVALAVVWTLPNGSVPISKPDDDWYHFWIPIALAWGFALRAHEPAARQNGHASQSLW